MEELEQQREALETSILQEQIEKPPITREQILFWFDQFRHGDPADIAFQEKVIDCFVNSIYLFDDRIVVNFNYQEGGRPVSLEEVLSSFLDGDGAPKNTATFVAVFFYAPSPSGRVHASRKRSHSPRGDWSLKTFRRNVFLTLPLMAHQRQPCTVCGAVFLYNGNHSLGEWFKRRV